MRNDVMSCVFAYMLQLSSKGVKITIFDGNALKSINMNSRGGSKQNYRTVKIASS